MENPVVIAALLTTAVALVFYAFMVERPTNRFAVGESTEVERSGFMKFVGFASSEIYASLPTNFAKALTDQPSNDIELLIQRSGNPWNIRASEFNFLRVVTGIFGLVGGFALGLVMNNFSPLHLPIYVWVAFGGFIGFLIPKSKYTSAAKQRDIDFKRQLPDALDLLIISLSAGVTFPTALREALPNMKPGVLKDELRQVSRSLDAGKTLSESLDQFAEKAPSESITAFVRAVKEATELNVPLIEVLESRADASRKEYFALLQQRTASLESKMMAILTPTLIPALLILVIAPSIASMMQTMGL